MQRIILLHILRILETCLYFFGSKQQYTLVAIQAILLKSKTACHTQDK